MSQVLNDMNRIWGVVLVIHSEYVVKENALDFAIRYPRAVKVVEEFFYVDDCLTGSDSIQDAVEFQIELQDLFSDGRFLLQKWNSSEPSVLWHISTMSCRISSQRPRYLAWMSTQGRWGIEWNSTHDQFRLTVADHPQIETMTNRALVSGVAKINKLGWYSPTILKAKIFMQQLWSENIG